MTSLGRTLASLCLCTWVTSWFSKSPEEHAEHLRLVLQLLLEHELYTKRAKCTFNQPELEFLGHIVGSEGPGQRDVKVSHQI